MAQFLMRGFGKDYRLNVQQPWESAAAFGHAVVKVFTYAVFLFRFYSVVDNS